MSFFSFIKIFCKSNYLTFLILILAFFVRFYNFDKFGFWGDEYLTFYISEPLHTYNEIFTKTLGSGDHVPPFYYYILNIYNYLFGYSAYSLRLFHIIFGVLTIVLVYFISNFLFPRSANNLVLFLLSINIFLIWCSNEVRVVSFVLFFQLLVILIFFKIIKEFNYKISISNITLLILLNIISLTIHPLSIVIVMSQIFFLCILLKIKKNQNNKKIFIYILYIFLSLCVYLLLNKEYFIWSLKGTRLEHNQLNINFFIGYNFRHYFTSYILGFINLIIIFLLLFRLKKNLFTNLYILYLLIIFILTYIFIILGTFLVTGLNAQRYWSFLVPIIIIVNIYYLTKLKNNLFSKILILFLIIYSSINYFKNINFPQVRKPDSPNLIKIFNNSNVNYIVSSNYYLFEHYLKYAYKNFNKKIISEEEINDINVDYWYLCLDLTWAQLKGSYSDEIYDCYPKNVQNNRHSKVESLKINGFVLTKYKFNK